MSITHCPKQRSLLALQFTALETGGQAFEVLNQDRSAMKSIDEHRDLRSDLPSWCPDWSIAGRAKDSRFIGHESRWQASGTTRFVYSRPSTVLLALKGLVVCKLKLCCNSIIRAIDVWVGPDDVLNGRESLCWFDHSENLRKSFELQSPASDHVVRNAVVRTFQRMLSTDSIISRSGINWLNWLGPLLFYDRFNADDLAALLAPVYLEAVDPELFKAAGFEIDSRIPSGDYDGIRFVLSQLFKVQGTGTRLFVTENSMQGAGYPGVQQGDLVCILCGSKTPQILRQVKADDDDHYILVGACSVDGLMFGEGLEMGLTEREFILV